MKTKQNNVIHPDGTTNKSIEQLAVSDNMAMLFR